MRRQQGFRTKLRLSVHTVVLWALSLAPTLAEAVPAAVTTTPLSSSVPVRGKASTRIKDIVNFEGVRDNQLVGYGLVLGLNGTGDGLAKSTFTKESLISMLERMGVNTRDVGNLDTRNVAAVMVTATLPPFARHGSRLDVTVSALGDARNLTGGTLLVTPLMAADGEVYAVAQGSVATSSIAARGQAQSVTKGVPTSGRIANGAIVEREVGFELAQQGRLKLSLRNPDFTTARRISDAINTALAMETAKPLDSGTVDITIPETYTNDVVTFLTKVEQLSVVPDQRARIVVDDHDGVIVMGENIRISRVAVSHGSLTVKINEKPMVSQPNPFTAGTAPGLLLAQTNLLNAQGQNLSAGQPLVGNPLVGNPFVPPAPLLPPATATSAPAATPAPTAAPNSSALLAATPTTPSLVPSPPLDPAQALATNLAQLQMQQGAVLRAQGPGGAQTKTVARTSIDVNDGRGAKMTVVESGADIHELVNSLNALGASPRDMITILHSIKAAGALQADIDVI